MADIGGNEGVNRLARALQGRMRELDDTPPVLDFGTIQADMSLMTNTFPKAIPQNDYIACKSLTWRDENNDMRIKAGDRVLVVWIGDDACVIDIIIPASAIARRKQRYAHKGRRPGASRLVRRRCLRNRRHNPGVGHRIRGL